MLDWPWRKKKEPQKNQLENPDKVNDGFFVDVDPFEPPYPAPLTQEEIKALTSSWDIGDVKKWKISEDGLPPLNYPVLVVESNGNVVTVGAFSIEMNDENHYELVFNCEQRQQIGFHEDAVMYSLHDLLDCVGNTVEEVDRSEELDSDAVYLRVIHGPTADLLNQLVLNDAPNVEVRGMCVFVDAFFLDESNCTGETFDEDMEGALYKIPFLSYEE